MKESDERIMYKAEASRAGIKKDIGAIIVAAGYSSRMNAFKPLLPLGSSTVIETAIDSFLGAGIHNIRVVVGFNADRLKPILERKGINWVYNESYGQGMYTSVLAGVKSLDSEIKGFFFLPVDIPSVRSHTIGTLCDAFMYSGSSIVYPVFRERRGHPPLISSALSSEILMHDGTGGLKNLLGKYNHEAYHVEVEDEGILLDLDTQEDYLKLCKKA